MFGFVRKSEMTKQMQDINFATIRVMEDFKSVYDKKIQMLCKCEHGFEYCVATGPRVYNHIPLITGYCREGFREKKCLVCGKVEIISKEQFEIEQGKQLLEKHGYEIKD